MQIDKVNSTDPRDHAQNLAKHLHALKDHCRTDISDFKDPAAKALFETAAEVLGGLEKAFTDFKTQNEEAFRN